MKRGLSTLALLCGTAASLPASAQDGADENSPGERAAGNDAPEAPAQPTTPADTDATATNPAAAEADSAPQGTPGGTAAPQTPAPQPVVAPELVAEPELDPEVTWEGDSDDHNPGYVPGSGGYRQLGLSPWTPRYGAMPGGITAPSGSDTWDEDWTFSFHGYLESTLRAGWGQRTSAADGQALRTWHSTPIVPGRFGDFENTQAVPGPWVQLNFTYGNPYVSATAIIAGFNQQSGASYAYPSSQLGLNDVYLTLRAPRVGPFRIKAHAGAFQDRYGAMAQYSEGNYGHSIIAYTRGTGATVISDFDLFGDLVGLLEVGFKGTLDKPPAGIEPNDANAFADAQNGAGYLSHAHFGVVWGEVDIAAHWLGAFSRDDRVLDVPVRPGEPIANRQPDGRIDTYGLTLRALGEPYGHFFAGVGYTVARDARSVPRVINILNTDGGRGLMEEYLGMQSGGNGELLHAGFQYDLSLQKFLHYPTFFNGAAPDLRASFFGTFVHVNSAQDSTTLPGFEVRFDDVNKLKLGSELTYLFFSWMGVSARYDYVAPDLDDSERTFHVLSPKILFRTSFLAHEQFNIRYTRWVYGDRVLIQSVAPNDPQGLDEHMLALQANMWW
jgi:hypothetical protein